MHRDAELGIAAHWKYKEGGERSPRDDAKFDWLRQLIERQQELEDPHEFLDVLKVDLFPDEVFVFTPKGDVVNLPKGATPIDFAYAIHSQVGERCSGARVNGKHGAAAPGAPGRRHGRGPDERRAASEQGLARLRGLGQGAQQDPPRDPRWQRTRAPASSGATLLEKEMRRAGLSLPRALERGELDEVARVRARGGVDDLLAAVGYGRVPAVVVVRALRPDWQPEVEPEVARPRRPARAPRMLRDLFRRPPRSSSTGIRVEGQGDVLVRFANCCAPLPGDDVVGFVTRGPRHHRPPEGLPRRSFTSTSSAGWTSTGTRRPQVARRIRMKVHVPRRARASSRR